MEFLSYIEPAQILITDGQFDYQGGRYRGKGWLRWNPETGARIDIVAQRIGPPLSSAIPFGYSGLLKPEHYTTIRMRSLGLDWIIAPHIGLVDEFDIAIGSCLSVDVRRLIMCRECTDQVQSGYSGYVTLAFHKRTHLFSSLHEITKVAGKQVKQLASFGRGVRAQIDGIEICGSLDDRWRARIDWVARDCAITRQQSWSFGYALHAAMSLCTGCCASILERQLVRNGHEYRELRPWREPTALIGLEWFSSPNQPNAEECLRLALKFISDKKLLTMAWGVFSELVVWNNQQTWGSSELLVALIFEGILRTLDNRPFVDGKKYDIKQAIIRLRPKHFPSITEAQCKTALGAHRRLRHHNAHPEWLSLGQRFSHTQLTQSTKDMSYLSKVYGKIIFEFAELPSLAGHIELA